MVKLLASRGICERTFIKHDLKKKVNEMVFWWVLYEAIEKLIPVVFSRGEIYDKMTAENSHKLM